jgi:hypothetical protein
MQVSAHRTVRITRPGSFLNRVWFFVLVSEPKTVKNRMPAVRGGT